MNRRNFIRSLGGAVAATLLPFVAPVRVKASEPDWIESVMAQVKAIKEKRPQLDTIDIFTDSATAEMLKKAFVETFFFNKPIPDERTESQYL